MLELKSVRVQLDPSKDQLSLIQRFAGCRRAVYNTGLEQRRWFARPGRSMGYQQQASELAEFKAAFPWLGEAPHHVLQQALIDLEGAYKKFWAGQSGAPQRKRRGVDDSFRYPDPVQVELIGNLAVPDKKRTRSVCHAMLKLPKLGLVPCVLHRGIPAGSSVKSITVSREGTKWFASILVERTINAPADRSGHAVVGIDLGVAQPVVLSTGEKYQLPKATAGDREHLAKLQQSVSRKVKGSRNRNKAIRRLAAFKSHQTRVRRDAMEKLTTAIAKNHGVVAMEDLRIQSMTASARGTVEEPGTNVAQKSGLNRSILDVAPGAVRMRLGYKLAASGGMLLLVAPHHTSQRCSKCGHISAENRVERDLFACTKCAYQADADVNAAENIRQKALGVWGDADKVEVANSLALLLQQQGKPKRAFKKKPNELAAAGLAASACEVRGLRHGQCRKRVAVTQPSKAVKGLTRSSVV